MRTKLESGFLFWEIDYVAMDFTPHLQIKQTRLSVATALDQDGRDVSDLLLQDDDLYYHQPQIGDEVILTFPIPEVRGGVCPILKRMVSLPLRRIAGVV